MEPILKVRVLELHVKALRDLFNGKLQSEENDETWHVFAKRTLRLNDESDWNFICTGMDLVSDTCFAIDHFMRFGLDGATRYDEFGERYLRLYGILNAAYVQQEATRRICKLCQLANFGRFKSKIENLELRILRNKLASHGVDFIDRDGQTDGEILSFVPVRRSLGGMRLQFVNNSDMSIHSANLLSGVEEHIELMTDILYETFSKTTKTLYKGNLAKTAEMASRLEELEKNRRGLFTAQIGDKEVTMPFNTRFDALHPRIHGAGLP